MASPRGSPNGTGAQGGSGAGLFDTLNGPRDVVTFETDNGTYAMVASERDSGVQVIRIRENGTLEATYSARHGMGGFDMLSEATSIVTFEMNNNTYAMVATYGGVQLIRAYNNGTLEAISSAAHGNNFTFNGARSIDTFEMAGGRYAAVASWSGYGAIQLIRIHEDGRLEAAGSARGSSGGFPLLNSATAINTFKMGGDVYATVVWSPSSSRFDSGILLARIYENGTLEAISSAVESSDGFALLNGARNADALEVGGSMYTAVASGGVAGHEDGILMVRVHENGTLEAAATAIHGTRGFDALRTAHDIDVFEMRGATYAAVSSIGWPEWPDDIDPSDYEYVPVNVGAGIQIVRVHENGTLEAVASAMNSTDGFDTIGWAVAIDAFKMGGGTYAMAASWDPDNGVQLARIHENGTLEAVASAADGEVARTPTAAAVVPRPSPPAPPPDESDGGTTTTVVVPPTGAVVVPPTPPPSVPSNIFDTLNGPKDVEAFEMGNGTYAMVVAEHDYGVQLVRMHGNGTLEAISSATHGSGGFMLHSANDAVTFKMGGVTHAMVSAGGSGVDGVQLIRIHGDGRLDAISSATHGTGGFTLRHAGAVDAFEMGGNTYAVVTSWQGNGAVQLIRIHENGRLEAISSAHGGSGGFPGFYGARDIDAFEMGGNTYAAVAWSYASTFRDSGVHIMRIHENGVLEAISYATDSTDGFGALRGTDDIDVFTMGGNTYAMVAAGGSPGFDDGVHLIRIHENGTLQAITSAGHRSEGFDALRGANAVDTFEMGGATYAAVASFGHLTGGPDTDDEDWVRTNVGAGVQLIRIHEDGRLEAINSAIDGSNGFDTLDAANAIDTFAIGGNTYAMVGTWFPDNGIQLIRIHGNGTLEAGGSATDGAAARPPPGGAARPPPGPVAIVLPPGATVVLPPGATVVTPPNYGTFDTLKGPRAVDTFEMGGAAHAMVAATQDDGVQLIRIHENGALEAISSATHRNGGFDTLRRPSHVDVFEMGGAMYAMVGAGKSFGVHGVQLIRIHEDGRLDAISSAAHGTGGFTLQHAGAVDAFEMGNNTYAIVTSWHGNGALQLIRIHEDGRLDAISSAHGGTGGFPGFYGARAIDAFEMGGSVYAMVAWSYASSFSNSGVHLARIHENGTLEAISHATDSTDGFGALYGVDDIDVFTMGGNTYAMVAAGGSPGFDDGVQLIHIHENGTLEAIAFAGHRYDGFGALYGATGVDAFEMGGATYAMVAASRDDGVQLIRVHENGALEAVSSATDGSDGFDILDSATGVDTFAMGGGAYAMVASWYPDSGVQLVRIHGNGTLEAGGSATDGEVSGTPPTRPSVVVVSETPENTHIVPDPGGQLPSNRTGISRDVAAVTFAPRTNFTSTTTGVPYTGNLNVTVASDERRSAAVAALAGLGNGSAGGIIGAVVEIGSPDADIALSGIAAIWIWNQPPSATLYHMNSTGSLTVIPECGNAADPVGWLGRVHDSTPFCYTAPGGNAGAKHYTIYTYRLSTFLVVGAVTAPTPAPPTPTPAPPAPGNGTDPAPPPPTPTPAPPAPGNGTDPAPPAPPEAGAAFCSIRLGDVSLALRVSPGGVSPPAEQTITNTGSQGLRGVEINASRWYVDPAGDPPYGADAPSLPPSHTELSAAGSAGAFTALLADGTAPSPLAAGLEAGGESSLWLRINLDGRAEQGGTLVQHVTYVAECAPP